jgi:type II secretory pathway pseudopilin PulG
MPMAARSRGMACGSAPVAVHAGVGLVELLVALAIVALLTAIVLPAIQASRERARRVQCVNNLRQLLLAVQTYEGLHHALPLNYGMGPFTDQNTGASWMQQILPHLDRADLHSQIRFGWPLALPPNARVAQTPVRQFLCPSDSVPGGVMNFRANVPGHWAVTNYKACTGSNWNWGTFAPVVSQFGRFRSNPDGLDHGNGAMPRGAHGQPVITRLANVRDGISQTFLLGEAVPEYSRHNWWYWFNGSLATCAIPLNHNPRPDLQIEMEGDWWHNYSFFSRHTGGAHFGLFDGSARFVSDQIDLALYRNLATIDGQEAATMP